MFKIGDKVKIDKVFKNFGRIDLEVDILNKYKNSKEEGVILAIGTEMGECRYLVSFENGTHFLSSRELVPSGLMLDDSFTNISEDELSNILKAIDDEVNKIKREKEEKAMLRVGDKVRIKIIDDSLHYADDERFLKLADTLLKEKVILEVSDIDEMDEDLDIEIVYNKGKFEEMYLWFNSGELEKVEEEGKYFEGKDIFEEEEEDEIKSLPMKEDFEDEDFTMPIELENGRIEELNFVKDFKVVLEKEKGENDKMDNLLNFALEKLDMTMEELEEEYEKHNKNMKMIKLLEADIEEHRRAIELAEKELKRLRDEE